jgi:hypothetical protein
MGPGVLDELGTAQAKVNTYEMREEIKQWLLSLPEDLVKQHTTLRDIVKCYKDGRSISANLVEEVVRMKREWDVDQLNDDWPFISNVLQRIDSLKSIIREVDGVREDDNGVLHFKSETRKKRSAWNFVNEVQSHVQQNLKVSQRQLKALNQVYKRYKKMNNGSDDTFDDYNDIPF